MKNKLIAAALVGASAFSIASAKNNDPVLFTIDGQDIRLSEFEYLYNKNNAQQAEPVTFDQYVNMFIDYKLKVADARAMGIDTTANFKKEFKQFSDDLATPYLRDETVTARLVQEAYDRMAEEVHVSHIMFPTEQPSLADSVAQLIASGAITFEDAARNYSTDHQSAIRGGLMGWVDGNTRLPYKFIEVCYSTPVGEVSAPVNSGYGYHLVRPEERRPASGQVHARHILVGTRGLDSLGVEAAKARIDSIYSVVTAPGADFAAVAMATSEDPGLAKRGGELGWFGRGQMVQEFEDVAFGLADSTISKPFASAFGYHIIQRLGHRGGVPLPPIEQLSEQIERSFESDERGHMAITARVNQLADENNSSKNPDLAKQVTAFLTANGFSTLDSAAMEQLRGADIVAYTYKGKPFMIGQLMASKPLRLGVSAEQAGFTAASAQDIDFEEAMIEIGRQQLMAADPDYRNLVNEYRDGIMLFDASNARVWNRAAEDTEGLEAFFQANKQKYTWDKPKYKAYVIFAPNDSTLNVINAYVQSNYGSGQFDHNAFVTDLKNKFGATKVRIERVIAGQGDNAITDYLGFGAVKPEPIANTRWPSYFAFKGHVIENPEEAVDVKSSVIADYQAALEKQWLDELHGKYKVTIHKGALKKAAARAENK